MIVTTTQAVYQRVCSAVIGFSPEEQVAESGLLHCYFARKYLSAHAILLVRHTDTGRELTQYKLAVQY